MTLDYTVTGTAKAGEDYTEPSGTVTIPAGETSGVIAIATLMDGLLDPDETLVVELTDGTSSGRDVTIGGKAATATILDQGEISAAVAGAQGAEGGPVEFTVTLSGATDAPVEVQWRTLQAGDDVPEDETAAAGVDYKLAAGTVTINEESLTGIFTVATVEDTVAEGDEQFRVELTGAARVTGPDTSTPVALGIFSASGTILDDDDPPTTVTLTATPGTVAEDAGGTELSISAALNGTNPLAVDTQVLVTVADGSATPGGDYAATTATLTIPAGQLSGTAALTLTPVDDLVAEDSETVQVTGASAGLEVVPAEVTITDNDNHPTAATLTVTPDTVYEGAGATDLAVRATFEDGDPRTVDTPITLSLEGVSLPLEEGGPTTAATGGDEAVVGGADPIIADFVRTTVTLTIPAGEREGTATLTMMAEDDRTAEGDETLQVAGAADNLTVTPAPVTIRDNDQEPDHITLIVAPLSIDEDAGAVELEVKAGLENGGSRTVDTSVVLSVHSVTATEGDDYSAPPAVVLTIPAGRPTGTVMLTLTVVNDDLHEGEEHLAVRGTNAEPGLPVRGVQVAIADDDPAPTSIVLSLDQDEVHEGAGLQDLIVTATLEGGGSRSVATPVTLTTSNVTTTDKDYWASPGALRIDSGQLTGTAMLRLVPVDDSVDEADETFEVRGAAAGDDLPVSARQVTITDDDAAGVTLSTGALTVVEGGSATYTVVLDSQPSADVTVTVSGHDDTDITVTNDTLTFTASNWNVAQTVTFSAAQDADAATDDAVTLDHAVTGTGEYETVTAGSVTVTIDEVDTAGVSIDPTALTVTEGSSDSYTVVLDAQPGDDVTVTVSGHDGTDISLSGDTLANDVLTFTSENWNVAQTVTVSAGQDDDAASDADVTLSHAVGGTGEYETVTAGSVTVAIVEKDTSVLSVGDARAAEGGGNVVFTVSISAASGEDVTVDYATSDGTAEAGKDYTETGGTLTFPANSVAVRTVSVPVTDDTVDEAEEETFTLTLSNAQGASLAGGGSTLAATGTITDDDTAGVTVSETSLTIDEGGSATYTVVLDSQPSAAVTVTVSGHDNTDITVSGDTLANDTLTFTVANWNVAQTVTVSAAQDADAATDADVTLGHAVSGTGEYENVSAGSVTVAIVEKDTA